MSGLAGKRILLVEDEFIVAMMVEAMLGNLGATVIGPAGTVAEGVRLAGSEPIDGAVLDMNMGGEPVGPVVDALQARRVPYVFATGYGRARLDAADDTPVLNKPYTEEMLAEALTGALCGR